MRVRLAVLLALLAILAAVATAQSAKIRVGDLLDLSVLGQDDYSAKLQVATDGTVSGPGFHSIKVDGLTLDEAIQAIQKSMKAYLKNPQVFLSFEKQIQAYVYLAGVNVVGEPGGRIPFTVGIGPREVLAGVILPDNPDMLQGIVYRAGKVYKRFDVKPLLAGDPDTWSGPLEAADVVVVTQVPLIRVWFVDRVGRPGEIRLREGTTLPQGVAAAGGLAMAIPSTSNDVTPALINNGRIEVRRGTKTFMFSSRLEGKASGFKLESGDTVTASMPKLVTVHVLGKVTLQSAFTVEEGTDVLGCLAVAHGVTSEGSLRSVYLFHGESVRRLNLEAAASGHSKPKVSVEAGDLIYVPSAVDSVYVLGEVKTPGKYPLPDGQKTRAVNVLAMGHGLTPAGSPRKVILMRAGEDGVYRPQVFDISKFLNKGDPSGNPEIKPGDVVVFGQPKGLTMDGFSRLVSSALLLDTLLHL